MSTPSTPDTTPLHLRTTLVTAGPACAIVLTDEQVEQLGAGKRAPVRVTIGETTERLRVARMGGQNLIGFNKQVRAAFGVEAGDVVEAVIEVDDAPRTVDVPDDLAAALRQAPDAQALFEALSFTHAKEYARWVTEAKRPETRARRVAQTIELLRAGKTR